MKRKGLFFLMLFFLFFSGISGKASADIGSRVTTEVRFRGLKGKKVYATLLSYFRGVGPNKAWDGTEKPKYGGNKEIWKRFVNYKDHHGFSFLQKFWECSEDKPLSWYPYPPRMFKLLLYDPETDTFRVSESKLIFGFNNSYTAEVGEDGRLSLKLNVLTRKNTEALFIRLIVVLVVEIFIAMLYGLRERKAILVILLTNVVMQTIFHFWLCYYYYDGIFRVGMKELYITSQLVMATIKFVIYYFLLRDDEDTARTMEKMLAFTLNANLASYILGFIALHYHYYRFF